MPRRFRRPTLPPRPWPPEEEREWILYNVGLSHSDLNRMNEAVLKSAIRLEKTWPALAPAPTGLTDDFIPELFKAAAQIAQRDRVLRSALFKQGLGVSITDLADAKFLSLPTQRAITTFNAAAYMARKIEGWPAAIGAFRDEKFYIATGGAIGRAEIIRNLFATAAIVIHSRFSGRGVEERDLEKFMDGPLATFFQTRLHQKFPAFQGRTGKSPRVSLFDLAIALQPAYLDIETLRENRIIVNGNGNGNGHGHKPKEYVTIDLDQLARLTTAVKRITPPRILSF